MAKTNSRSITPLPGWRYIVLPALTPAELEPPKPTRRRLADNVVSMFTDERAPVVNQNRRGRLPRGVIALRRWERIHVGDYCVVWGSAASPSMNHGRLVRITARVDASLWDVEAVDGMLTTFDPAAPEDASRYLRSSTATVNADRLRRCAKPAQS
jgi:hypothetical protein